MEKMKANKLLAGKLTPASISVTGIDVGVQTEPVIILEAKEKEVVPVRAVDGGSKDRSETCGNPAGKVEDRGRPRPSTSVSAMESESDSDDEVTVVDIVQKKQIATPEENEKIRREGKLWWQFREEKDKPHVLEGEEEDAVVPASGNGGTLRQNATNRKRTPNVIPDHIRILTGTGEPPLYQCVPCNSKFRDKSTVSHHRFCGTGDYPFQCEQCGKGFDRKSVHERHLRSHTGERSFPCTQCGKRYSRKEFLTQHLITHNRDVSRLRFRCQKCGKRFGLQSHLTVHLWTHSTERERRFRCDQCPIAFSSNADLRQHLCRVHYCERTFKCLKCGCEFGSKDQVKAHIRTVHHQQPSLQVVTGNEEGGPVQEDVGWRERSTVSHRNNQQLRISV